jgi:hypothetical protein
MKYHTKPSQKQPPAPIAMRREVARAIAEVVIDGADEQELSRRLAKITNDPHEHEAGLRRWRTYVSAGVTL